MNLLITGIHGFVGSNLVKTLSKNNTIYGLDIINPEKDGVVKTFSWDDLDKDLIPNIDVIIHLAGKAHDTKNKSQADVYFKINTDLTKKIYDYALEKGIKKFIFFSSVKAAADSVQGDVLTEDIIPNPVGPYGESKIAAENYILSTTRLCRPLDSPGKNTGVGCCFLLQCMKVKSESEVAQLCPTPHDPTDRNPPVLEWSAITFSSSRV